jgi:hypothetical protein
MVGEKKPKALVANDVYTAANIREQNWQTTGGE